MYFNSERDHEYPFNSAKKRSSVLITQPNGTLRLYSKGASETSEFVVMMVVYCHSCNRRGGWFVVVVMVCCRG